MNSIDIYCQNSEDIIKSKNSSQNLLKILKWIKSEEESSELLGIYNKLKNKNENISIQELDLLEELIFSEIFQNSYQDFVYSLEFNRQSDKKKLNIDNIITEISRFIYELRVIKILQNSEENSFEEEWVNFWKIVEKKDIKENKKYNRSTNKPNKKSLLNNEDLAKNQKLTKNEKVAEVEKYIYFEELERRWNIIIWQNLKSRRFIVLNEKTGEMIFDTVEEIEFWKMIWGGFYYINFESWIEGIAWENNFNILDPNDRIHNYEDKVFIVKTKRKWIFVENISETESGKKIHLKWKFDELSSKYLYFSQKNKWEDYFYKLNLLTTEVTMSE